SIDSFREACERLLKGEQCGGDIEVFLQLVHSTTDFCTFVDIASKPKKRDYFFYILKSWSSSLKSS
ncbi:unnamed protein product, partial [Chrysoparadoxa australica]